MFCKGFCDTARYVMGSFVKFMKKRFDVFFLCFGAMVMLCVLVANFIALRNNVIFSDESWYLCLLRDLPHHGAVRFQHLFFNVFDNDIYLIRLFCWSLQLMGDVVFSVCVCVYVTAFDFSLQKNDVMKNGWALASLVLLCALYFGKMRIVSCPSLNYNTLKVIFAEFSIGFLLVGLTKQKVFWYVVSGFFVGVLFASMITSVILLPFLFALIVILSSHKWRDSLGLLIGLLLFCFYYFFFESPKDVMMSVVTMTNKVVNLGSSDYGIVFLIKWVVDAFMYLGKCFFVATALYCCYFVFYCKDFVSSNKKVKLCFWVLVSSFVLLWSWMYFEPVTPSGKVRNAFWARDLYWELVFVLLLLMAHEKTIVPKELWILLSFLLIFPICLSFGSNVPFYSHNEVLFFVTLVMVYLMLKQSFVKKVVVTVVLVLQFVLFLSGLSGKNWDGNKFFGNHIPVETIGIHQSINLEEAQIKELEVCRQIIPQGKILNSAGCWGMVCLLDYTPVSYEFAIDRNDANYIRTVVDDVVREDGHLWVVSHTWENNGTDGLVDKVLSLSGYEVVADTIDEVVFVHVSQ